MLILWFLSLLILSGCLAHKVSSENINELPGFWMGTWHGLISFFSFIGSLFDDSIVIYAVNNNGHWYDFGFVGGFFIILRIIAITLKSNNK